jgi:glycolate oxidase iron-sulfur subunit
MLHHLDPDTLGPHGPHMARAIQTCVHCGFCLPACPTYKVLGEEMDSPRGRIFLMKNVLEGELSWNDALPYVDRCLGCVACVTACPSGVAYGELLTPFRAQAEANRQRTWIDRLRRTLTLATLPYPTRFRIAARVGQLTTAIIPRTLVPRAFRSMLDLLPAAPLPAARPLPDITPAVGTRKARVALLAGCAQQVLSPNIGWAAVRVLSRAGVEVLVPRDQGCCGALALHVGEEAQARKLAQQNLRAFPKDIDAIVTTAAGCGSGLRDYAHLFDGAPAAEAAEANAFAARAIDIAAFLERLGMPPLPPLPPLPPPPLPAPARASAGASNARAAAGATPAAGAADAVTVAYHDACHLAHAQGVRAEPRALLRRIPNVTLVDVPDAGDCCGSAGTYNLDQPEIANDLGRRKANALLSTRAAIITSGNIGCLTQIRTHLASLSSHANAPLPDVLHTIELIDRAMSARGEQ